MKTCTVHTICTHALTPCALAGSLIMLQLAAFINPTQAQNAPPNQASNLTISEVLQQNPTVSFSSSFDRDKYQADSDLPTQISELMDRLSFDTDAPLRFDSDLLDCDLLGAFLEVCVAF